MCKLLITGWIICQIDEWLIANKIQKQLILQWLIQQGCTYC